MDFPVIYNPFNGASNQGAQVAVSDAIRTHNDMLAQVRREKEIYGDLAPTYREVANKLNTANQNAFDLLCTISVANTNISKKKSSITRLEETIVKTDNESQKFKKETKQTEEDIKTNTEENRKLRSRISEVNSNPIMINFEKAKSSLAQMKNNLAKEREVKQIKQERIEELKLKINAATIRTKDLAEKNSELQEKCSAQFVSMQTKNDHLISSLEELNSRVDQKTDGFSSSSVYTSDNDSNFI